MPNGNDTQALHDNWTYIFANPNIWENPNPNIREIRIFGFLKDPNIQVTRIFGNPNIRIRVRDLFPNIRSDSKKNTSFENKHTPT